MDFLRKNTKRSWKNTKSKEIELAKISAKLDIANTSDYTKTGDGLNYGTSECLDKSL